MAGQRVGQAGVVWRVPRTGIISLQCAACEPAQVSLRSALTMPVRSASFLLRGDAAWQHAGPAAAAFAAPPAET